MRIPGDAIMRLNPAILWLYGEDGSTGFYYHPDHAIPARNFTIQQTAIMERLANAATQQEILADINVSAAELADFLNDLTSWITDAIAWQDAEIPDAQARHRRHMEATRLRDIWTAMQAQRGENLKFHQTQLNDSNRQFDDVETTISHIFRNGHEALQGRSYGEAFCDWLLDNGHIGVGTQVMEVGCGLGYFADAILNRIAEKRPDIYKSLRYTLFDLSSTLQETQKRNMAAHATKVEFLQGDIETYDFGGRSFDLVISNEVIADLPVAEVCLENIQRAAPQTDAEKTVCKYDLDCAAVTKGSAKKALINIGAIRMVENLHDLLSERGCAVITEYGSLEASPKAVKFANHNEFTIHFGHLHEVSRHIGFTADIMNMGECIGFDANSATIRMEALRTLTHCLLPHLQKNKLPILAYTASSLKAALGEIDRKVGNVQFLPLNHPESLSPFRFKLLLLGSG